MNERPETRCDPAGDTQTIAIQKEHIQNLEAEIDELRRDK